MVFPLRSFFSFPTTTGKTNNWFFPSSLSWNLNFLAKICIQNYHFLRSRRGSFFWLVDCVLSMFSICYAYEKCSLESKLTFRRTYSIIRYLQSVTWQEKAFFVHFKEMIFRNSQNPLLDVKKSFFEISTGFPFWLVDCIVSIFFWHVMHMKNIL